MEKLLEIKKVSVKEKYDSMASSYDNVPDNYMEQWEDEILFNDIKGKRILDIGCGTGRLLAKLKRYGADTLGIANTGEICHLTGAKVTTSHPFISYNSIIYKWQFCVNFFLLFFSFLNYLSPAS